MAYADLVAQYKASGYWPLTESSGTTADNLGATASTDDGTFVGAPTLNAQGPGGFRAITLNGTTQYLSAPLNAIAAAQDTGFTISVWVKTTSTTRGDVLGLSEGTNQKSVVLSLNRGASGNSAGRISIFNRANGSATQWDIVDSATGVNNGQWHHIAAVCSPTGATVYLDGVKQVTVKGSTAATLTNFESVWDHPLFWGALNNNETPANFFNGSLAAPAIFPYLLPKPAIEQLALVTGDRVSGSGSVTSPYQFDDDGLGHPCNIFATRWTPSTTGRAAFGWVVPNTSDNLTLSFTRDGGTPSTITLENTNLANNEGTYFENGVNLACTAGTPIDLLIEPTANGTTKFYGVIVRAPDPASGAVLEYGGATHCSPAGARIDGALFLTGVELYTGKRWAWKENQPAVEVFDGITADTMERYHNGFAVVKHPSGLIFVRVGHNQPGIAIRTAPAGVLSSLSATTTIGAGQLTYCDCDVDDAGNLWVLVRDQTSTDGLAAVKIATPFGTPTGTFDYVLSGASYYPRGLQCIGNDVYVAAQHRETSGVNTGWRALYAMRFNATAGTWTDLAGGNASGTSTGTIASPRIADPADVLVIADATGDGRQKYAMSKARFTADGGCILVADTATDDPLVFADTAIKWVSFDGATTTEKVIPDTLTANMYRLAGSIDIVDGVAYAVLADRGAWSLGVSYDDGGAYYRPWGARVMDKLRVREPVSSAPYIVPWGTADGVNDVHGFIERVDGADGPEFVYQDGIDPLHTTMMQCEVRTVKVGTTVAPPTFKPRTKRILFVD